MLLFWSVPPDPKMDQAVKKTRRGDFVICNSRFDIKSFKKLNELKAENTFSQLQPCLMAQTVRNMHIKGAGYKSLALLHTRIEKIQNKKY